MRAIEFACRFTVINGTVINGGAWTPCMSTHARRDGQPLRIRLIISMRVGIS